MKKPNRLFLRSFTLSSIIMICLFIGFFGISKAYENTVLTGFGEYKKAIEIIDGGIRILDFEFTF